MSVDPSYSKLPGASESENEQVRELDEPLFLQRFVKESSMPASVSIYPCSGPD